MDTLASTIILIVIFYFWVLYSRVKKIEKKQEQEEIKKTNLEKYKKDLDKIFDYSKIKTIPINKEED